VLQRATTGARKQETMNTENERLLRAFERLTRSGLRRSHFTRAIHDHLYLNFNFIAHFDRDGFYNARFEKYDDLVQTLRVIAHYQQTYDADRDGLNLKIMELFAQAAEPALNQAKQALLEELKQNIASMQRRVISLEGMSKISFVAPQQAQGRK